MIKTRQHFKYSFIVVSLIGLLCCLDRADYNLALGIFCMLMWSDSHFPQKHRILWTVFLSLIGDLAWIIGIGVIQWGKQPIDNYNLRTMTQIASALNMVYKIILIIFAICTYQQCQDMFSFSAFKNKVLYL